MPDRVHRRRGVAGLVGSVLLVVLAACSGTSEGWDDGGAQTGYVSGDGTVSTWAAGDREGPVRVTGTDYDGEPVDTADWAGDVVVLNTWYAACPPCRAEAPDLVEVAQEHPDVRFLGINSTDEPGTAEAFERTFDVPYPSVHDSGGAAVAALQGVVALNAVPTTVVLDTDGYVYARVLGRVDASTLDALVGDVLAEDAG